MNWAQFEEGLGITFPTYFKELIAVYGGSIWFDNYNILYPEATTTPDVETFLHAVHEQLDLLIKYGITDENFNPIEVPLYPESGGLFPFMVDFDGTYYFWKMQPADSNKWPLMRWEVDTLRTLPFATLAEMFVASIDDYKKINPNRVRVDRWEPPPSAG